MCTYCILCGSGVEEWRLQKQRRGTRGCTSPANGSSALPDEIIRRDLARAPSHASVSKSQKFVSLSLSLSLSLWHVASRHPHYSGRKVIFRKAL